MGMRLFNETYKWYKVSERKPQDNEIVLAETVYKVTFVDEDGTTVLFETNVDVGGTATYEAETPTKPGDATSAYAFSGWDPATMAAVTDADQTYTAQFAPSAAIAAVFEIADGGATTNNYASYADLHAALEAGKAAGKTVALLADVDLAGVVWTCFLPNQPSQLVFHPFRLPGGPHRTPPTQAGMRELQPTGAVPGAFPLPPHWMLRIPKTGIKSFKKMNGGAW